MAYEIYKQQLTKEEYFDNWDNEQEQNLNEDLKDQIYNKYLVKTRVFNRDNFTCQNKDCAYPDAPLTMHHVKWQKNGGEDKSRNCVTLCKTCHKGYHRGKNILIFSEDSNVPKHIRGHVFKVTQEDVVDWKKVKSDMKSLRKSFKQSHGLKLNEKQLYFLMKWLERVVDLDEMYDD